MEDMPKSIAVKLLNVRKEVESIKKSKRNDFQDYSYSSEADVFSSLKPLFNKYNLLVYPEIVDSKDMLITVNEYDKKAKETKEKQNVLTEIDLRIAWVDCDTGDCCHVQYRAKGTDRGDKGLSKAATFGFRSYLLKLIMDGEEGADENQSGNSWNGYKKDNYNNNYSNNNQKYGSQKPDLQIVSSSSGVAPDKKYECSHCHNPITQAVSAWSLKNLNKELCKPCQDLFKAGKLEDKAVGQ